MSETIGIIGLGRMGMVAAKKYIREGYQVVGYARRPEVIKEFTEAGGIALRNSREVAEKAGKVIVYVLNDQQVIDVVTGPDGILEGCHKGDEGHLHVYDRQRKPRMAGRGMRKKRGRFCGLLL